MPHESMERRDEPETRNAVSSRVEKFHNDSMRRTAAKRTVRRNLNFDTAFFSLHADKPYWERYARAMAYALENEPVHLFDDELLVGMLYQVGDNPENYRRDEAAWEPYSPALQARKRIAAAGIAPLASGGLGHIGWHWDRILELGVEGLLAHIERLLANAPDEKARQLYQGAIILWTAVLRWNDLHVAALREALDKAPPEDRPRLQELVDVCSRVPRLPPRSFREAVQSFNMQHLAVMFENPYGGNGPGRLDYFLWPYLERDMADGVIGLAQAKELVDELFIRFEERLHPADGWVEAVVVGGGHPDGSCAVNPLSHMMIHSIMALKQTHPSIYPRVGRDTPKEFLELCAKYLAEGGNRAQIYNDDVCIPAIVGSGTSREDAAMYMAGGCMEISVQGMNSDFNFTHTQNVAKILELVITGGRALRDGKRLAELGKDLASFGSFEELYAAFEAQLLEAYKAIVACLDIASECHAEHRPCYLLSSLVADCLERGREQQDGGARYHEYGFSPLGITSAADSLMAIKQAVFDAGTVSASGLLAALKADFAGSENLRRRLRSLPKYGAGHAEADAMCGRVMKSVCELSRVPKARFGGQLKPMIFTFVWNPSTSAELGARADGSRAGEYIGHGMTPQMFAMTEGITTAINSCASLDYTCVTGGATTMWDMAPEWASAPNMQALLSAFLSQGGMIFQGNTTSVDELIKARENPLDYPHLIVRVGGFSARFNTLDAKLQAEIISRRRHAR